MINYLKDIKKETLIGLLPDVINSNNESIRNEFNWIFDSSLNRLTKSVYAPTGSVKTHFGEFVNLSCEYFTVKNVDSLKASILDSVESIIRDSFDPSTKEITNHNLLTNRFVNPEYEEAEDHDFCHDAAAIVYKKDGNDYITVENILDSIDNNIINLQNCNNEFKFIYNGETYTAADLGEILEWKNSLGEILEWKNSLQTFECDINGHHLSILCSSIN